MRSQRSIDFFQMAENDPRLHRKITLLNAWFVRLDQENRSLLRSGRFRLLLLSASLLLLLLLNLLGAAMPDSALAAALSAHAAWIYALEIGRAHV